jgi:hypothetical protein
VSPGRVDPKTGKLVVPTSLTPEGKGKLSKRKKESEERPGSRFRPGMFRPEDVSERREMVMSGRRRGYGVGCDSCTSLGASGSAVPNVLLFALLGFGAMVALEAFGVTNWTRNRQG